ncbi:type II toxin-antitoxin system HicA family toxin [Aetokthonos hydrillicola Thurmond2011]|jgi:predicted RNA binding protein YcfA (HicA-like mRNA interferase family)|uniref:Type II toxin-antitoxin system HicA family toxin n=1 Tax=Aetokthonos hydrillicola Thurmond2011 TaxID=2712845 RepID=A0AAP5M684_9CYAN|nr:type II toxin-antitoxin system HicA family toxin [Aetokthonos hydrillicola]MBO3458895.1 type II toxin-antitoxin system HicA family toxin [Aetokthonos hydrillicola CCALA 1050]MBW4587256.1 type II toxin-antitoxin system HicA family toxin [Aetokthonos hydrillicola CCALA 1050]MDR9896721.1 type II toxin-antitoxin system HicA family toxin [Aetokthonos hydrillicola Thurmond2011]
MVREIKFRELEHLLYSLGFVTVPTAGSHKIYQYPSSGTLVILPGYNQQAYVRSVHLVAVRRILSENGLMDSDKFNSSLEKVAS